MDVSRKTTWGNGGDAGDGRANIRTAMSRAADPGNTFFTVLESPIGPLTLTSDGRALTGLYVAAHWAVNPRPPYWMQDDSIFGPAAQQLARYWTGDARQFSVELSPAGTPFQRAVWDTLRAVPYGTTVTYGELARRVGRPSAARAVGAANGRNPISIFIPCHRVVGSNRSLRGYVGGVDTKRRLLALEGALES